MIAVDALDKAEDANVRAGVNRLFLPPSLPPASIPAIAGIIASWGVSTRAFVDVLTEKSEGNFMYVVQVPRDIGNGTLTAATVEGIDGLSQGLIPRSADPERFRLYEELVIGLLATVREPVDLGQVVAWTRTVWSSSGWHQRWTLSPIHASLRWPSPEKIRVSSTLA